MQMLIYTLLVVYFLLWVLATRNEMRSKNRGDGGISRVILHVGS